MTQNRRAIRCIRLQRIHYGINGIVRFKNDACEREYVFSYVFLYSGWVLWTNMVKISGDKSPLPGMDLRLEPIKGYFEILESIASPGGYVRTCKVFFTFWEGKTIILLCPLLRRKYFSIKLNYMYLFSSHTNMSWWEIRMPSKSLGVGLVASLAYM